MALAYQVTIPQLPALQRAFEQAPATASREILGAVNRSLVHYQGAARRLAPVDTGHLRGSIQIEPATQTGSSFRGAVGTATRYAEAQEEGSGIYGPAHRPIRPVRAKALRFTVNGRVVFTRQVAGSRGRWFFKGAVEQGQAPMERFFEQALDNIANQLARSVA